MRFNLAIEMLVISGWCTELLCWTGNSSFNLAIEMLVISGLQSTAGSVRATVAFQSRNRDACHFRIGQQYVEQFSIPRFNLAIEMLVISGPF